MFRAVVQTDPVNDLWIWQEDSGFAEHPQVDILLHSDQTLLSQGVDASQSPAIVSCNLIGAFEL
jgi:hypothetical protein